MILLGFKMERGRKGIRLGLILMMLKEIKRKNLLNLLLNMMNIQQCVIITVQNHMSKLKKNICQKFIDIKEGKDIITQIGMIL